MACDSILGAINSGMGGQIQMVLGPMFSGKTTELLRRLRRLQAANYRCLLVKYAHDDRYSSEAVSTHDRQICPATPATELLTLLSVTDYYDVIGIDEGQFFPDVVEFSERMADQGKTIIVAALDGTYQRKAFGRILDLVPLSESVIKLSAVCKNCYGDAAFTKRKGVETQVELIGGADKYLAACRRCFKEPGQTKEMCSPKLHEPIDRPLPSPSKLANVERKLFKDVTNSAMETQ